MFAPHRSFSQLATSFFGSWRQGILPLLFVACLRKRLSLRGKQFPSRSPACFRVKTSQASPALVFPRCISSRCVAFGLYPRTRLRLRSPSISFECLTYLRRFRFAALPSRVSAMLRASASAFRFRSHALLSLPCIQLSRYALHGVRCSLPYSFAASGALKRDGGAWGSAPL